MIGYRCDACLNHFAVPTKALHCPRCGEKRLTVLSAPGMTPVAMPPVQAIQYASPATLPPVPKRSLLPYTLCFCGSIGSLMLGILAILVAAHSRGDTEEVMILLGILLLLAAWFLCIGAWVLGLMVIYRGWRLVQPMRYTDPRDANMPTPGTAVGFLFIPFFNLYWNFIAFPGLVEKLNRMALQRGVYPRASHGVAMTTAVLLACGVVPYLGLLPMMIGVVMLYFVVKGVHASIDALA
jgi:hypothetical protein